MSTIDRLPQFITDQAGKRVGVILNLEDYDQLLAAREELEEIRVYDEAKASDDEAIPFDQAVREIEGGR